jgi:hypothetical protein
LPNRRPRAEADSRGHGVGAAGLIVTCHEDRDAKNSECDGVICTKAMSPMDILVAQALRGLAEDGHVRSWYGKERDWVNYFAHRHLMPQCSESSAIKDAVQICIEVAVPQPRGYRKLSVCRDLVIWHKPGGTCFTREGKPTEHPLAILEWKVHRPRNSNPEVAHERAWLRAYSEWQPAVFCYAIEVKIDLNIASLNCTAFLGASEKVLCHFQIPRERAADGEST